MSFAELIAKALDVNAANLALGNQQFRAEGATFVRNPAAPQIYDTNHVCADPTDTPKQMYAAMGFRPAAVATHYLKKLPSGP